MNNPLPKAIIPVIGFFITSCLILSAAPPSITSQPQSAKIAAGTGITLSVGVNGNLPQISSSNLRLWLKADAGVITNSSNRVSQWNDQSGNLNHCFQANTGQQPLLVPNGLNAQPLIRFDGIQDGTTGDFLQGTGDVGLTAGFTAFLVYKKGVRSSVEEIPAFIGAPNVFNAGRSFYIAGAEMAFSGWGNDYHTGFLIPPQTYRIWSERMNATKTQLSFFDTDGTNNFAAVRDTSGLSTPNSGYFVGGFGAATRNLEGDIAELIFYQGELTETERQSVENYLKNKYSLGTAPTGDPTLTYQWVFNGTNIGGATNFFFSLTNVQPANSGNYFVNVTNAEGNATSSNATITVVIPVSITEHPQSRALIAATNVTFNVSVIGDLPINYQRKFNGVNIIGATNSSFGLNNVQLTNAGGYSVFVSNSVSSALSSNAILSIVTFPNIITQPRGATVLAGTNITLAVSVQGGGPSALPTAGSGTLKLWLKADAGVVVNSNNRVTQWNDQSISLNHCSQADPNRQPLLVPNGLNAQPLIRFDGIQNGTTGDFLQGTGDVGLTAGFTSFLVYKKGDRTSVEEIPAYIGAPNVNNAGRSFYIPGNEMAFSGWGNDYRSGFIIPPQTYRIWTERMNATKTQLSFFDTDGTNNFTSVRSSSGLLTPNSGYFVGGFGAATRNLEGDIAELIFYQGALSDSDRLSVEDYLKQKYFQVGGGSPLAYQWQANGTNVLGATNATLTLTNSQPLISGNYTVIITNAVGSVTSAPAAITIRYIFPFGNGQRLTNTQYSFVTSANISFQKYFTNGTVFYTLDGSTPSFASRPYSAPFTLSRSATLRAIVYSPDFSQWGESDPVNITIMPTYTLTGVTAGGGTVAIGGTGPFLSNTVVNVTANPSNGWTFLQWLGDATGTNPATAVAMTRNKSARAVFGTTLSTTVAGNGAVFLNPNVGLYPFGSVVRLMAVPDSGSFFGIWGNAASGNTNPLDFVVINPNPTVSSLFSALSGGQFALTLSASGFGRVVASPRANSYASGQNVTLTATADSEQTFLGWTGDASGTNNPLTVTMSQSRNITANFSKNARLTLTFASSTVELEGFQLTLNGAFGESYSLQKSSNLVDWTTFVTVTNSFGTTQLSDLPSTNSSAQFYRTIQP